MLGERNDPRWLKFVSDLSQVWGEATAKKVLHKVAQLYVPRGQFNPHGTGVVFDLNFSIFHHVQKIPQKPPAEAADLVNFIPVLNAAALRSAVGMWLNTYAMLHFNFDTYDTHAEIWHMEWRGPKEGREYIARRSLLRRISLFFRQRFFTS